MGLDFHLIDHLVARVEDDPFTSRPENEYLHRQLGISKSG
jgi:hypothetical protein